MAGRCRIRWLKSGRPMPRAATCTSGTSTMLRSTRISADRVDVDRRRRLLPFCVDPAPDPYPWRNHYNAWRPAHIHFSVFGPAFATRLVTQMYFPGDPLLATDPIFNCTADESARRRLIAQFDYGTTVPETALGYRFDLILRGRDGTPMEAGVHTPPTTSQTVGPFFRLVFSPCNAWTNGARYADNRVSIEGHVLDAEGNGVPDACLGSLAGGRARTLS